ncbi:class I SAM-dependent methyltransferase [Aliikangiella sp. IMCC44359]|uniref:class I SAM-dependent methyltransferase n=1 Tax=Aliikangiella sp. IMCC44359 TaxID=3459125 RepID=UPI00403ABD78
MSNIRRSFDDYAADYDKTFSHSFLGRYYRSRTHKVLAQFFSGNTNVLELNSGTGEDAVYLAQLNNNVLATDLSSSMLKLIEHKIKKNELEGSISTKILDIQCLNAISNLKFDGVISNFGGLNCISDWNKFANDVSKIINNNGVLIVCVMGPSVPWEWLWFSLKGDFSKAFRRLSGKCSWRGSNIYYPKISEFENIIKNASFQLVYREALGTFMPPSYVNEHVEKWPVLYKYVAALEELFCRRKFAARLADHYLLVFKKVY